MLESLRAEHMDVSLLLFAEHDSTYDRFIFLVSYGRFFKIKEGIKDLAKSV